MASKYTAGEEENVLFRHIFITIKNNLRGDAEERLRRLKSMNTFLKEQFTRELETNMAEDDGSTTAPQGPNEPHRRTGQAVVTADCADLQNEVKNLRQNVSVKQKANKQMQQDLSAMKQSHDELTGEIRVLREQGKALDKEAEEITKQIHLKKKLPQNCLDLEAERDSIRQEVDVKQKHVSELKEREEWLSEEHRVYAKQLQDELAAAKACRSALNAEENRLTPLLHQQEDFNRYKELQNAIKNVKNENKQIEESITEKLIKSSEGINLKMRLTELLEQEKVAKRENEELKNCLKMNEKVCDNYIKLLPKHEEKARADDDMRKSNAAMEERTAHLKREIRKAKAKEDSYTATVKGSAELEARNKKLLKEQQILEKQLLKLNMVDETREQDQEEKTDVSREENRRLHEEIGSLEEQVTKKEVLAARMKRLAKEEESLSNTNKYMRERIVYLQKLKQQQMPLQEAISDYRERVNALQLDKQGIQKDHEELTVEIYTQNIRVAVVNALAGEGRALTTVNKEVTEKIQQDRMEWLAKDRQFERTRRRYYCSSCL